MNSAIQETAADERLLDDAAMQGFIRDGYLTVQSELPRAFHERMLGALHDLDEGGPLGHNNLLPCVPELAHMLDELSAGPRIRASLDDGPGTEALSRAVARVSRLIGDLGLRLVELDVNPLLVPRGGGGVIALDALVILRGRGSQPRERGHLALD